MQRIQHLASSLTQEENAEKPPHLKITDNRTGKTVEVPLSRSRESHFFNATALGKLKDEKDQPLRVFDPGYMNTICCVLIESYWQRPPRSLTSMEIEES